VGGRGGGVVYFRTLGLVVDNFENNGNNCYETKEIILRIFKVRNTTMK